VGKWNIFMEVLIFSSLYSSLLHVNSSIQIKYWTEHWDLLQ